MNKSATRMLGKMRDTELATHFELDYKTVREERVRRGIAPFRSPCGTRTRYRAGCRCDECREAQNTYQKAWYAR